MPQPIAVAPAPVNAPTKAPIVQVKPTVPAQAQPAAATPPADLHELVVNGEKLKLPLKDIIARAQKAEMAGGLTRQAKEALAAIRKREAEIAEEEAAFGDESKLDALLRKRGVDPDAFARKRLEKKLAEAEMTPEQRIIAERDAKIAELEGKTKAAEEEKRQAGISETAKRMQAHVHNLLGDAWERAGFVAGDADGFEAVYDSLREFRKLGILPKDINSWTPGLADQICAAAKENIDEGFKRLEGNVLKGLEGKALYDRLGKAVVDKLNRYQVEMIRGGGIKKAAPPVAPSAPAAAPSEYMSIEQARELMRGKR